MSSATHQVNRLNHEKRDKAVLTADNNEETFKRPAVQSLQLMKPSLSLTSLPPQSPKETSNDASNERPYNSLKVNFKFQCFRH